MPNVILARQQAKWCQKGGGGGGGSGSEGHGGGGGVLGGSWDHGPEGQYDKLTDVRRDFSQAKSEVVPKACLTALIHRRGERKIGAFLPETEESADEGRIKRNIKRGSR